MILLTEDKVFYRPFTHGRDLSPPYGGGQSVNGGTHEGGPNFDRLYHKLKLLLLKTRFSIGRLHMGGICPLHMGGTKC